MSAYYTFSYPLRLSEDDKRGIQYLYGVNPQLLPPTPPPPPPPPPPETNEIVTNVSHANAAAVHIPLHRTLAVCCAPIPMKKINAINARGEDFQTSLRHLLATLNPYPKACSTLVKVIQRMILILGFVPRMLLHFFWMNLFRYFHWIISCSHYYH